MPLWKWILLLVASILLSLLMYTAAQTPAFLVKGPGLWGLSLATSAAMLGLYALFVKWFEKEQAQDLPLKKGPAQAGIGFGIGVAYFIIVVATMLALTLYRVEGVNHEVMGMIDALFMFLVVAVGEEIVFRGVLFRWIDERFGFWWAMAVSGVVFGFAHLMNDGASLWSSVAIALEAGLMLAAAYKWSGNLWLPIGIHWAWNFTQGNIFGFAVSGQAAGSSLLQPALEGPQWLTGGAFGAEASVISAAVGITLTAWFVKEYLKR
jgi:hypothetical protein